MRSAQDRSGVSVRKAMVTTLVYLGLIFLSALVAVVMVRGSRPIYRVTMEVMPSSSGASLSGSSALSGGLATFLGGGGSSSQFMMFSQYVTSYYMAEQVQHDPQVMHALFSSEWDAQTQSYHPPRGFMPALRRFPRSILGQTEWIVPNAARTQEVLEDQIVLKKDNAKSDVYQIQVETHIPEDYAQVLSKLMQLADRKTLDEDVAYWKVESQRLHQQALQENRADVRDKVIADALAYDKMIASKQNSDFYAYKLVDAPYISPYPVGPSFFKFFVVCLALFVGPVFLVHYLWYLFFMRKDD